jgi:hypothetical protein
MTRFARFVFLAVVAFLSISVANRAEAFRFRRSWNCCVPCQHGFGDDLECLKTKIYPIGPHDFMYYAEYDAGGDCGSPSTETFEYGDVSTPQVCPSCVDLGPSCRHTASMHNWTGLGSPLEPDYKPEFSDCATVVGCHFECLKVCAENNCWKTFKIKVYDICLHNVRCPIHVAYEVSCFPDNVHPCCYCIGSGGCKCCSSGHAYTLKYCCKRVLLLTAN